MNTRLLKFVDSFQKHSILVSSQIRLRKKKMFAIKRKFLRGHENALQILNQCIKTFHMRIQRPYTLCFILIPILVLLVLQNSKVLLESHQNWFYENFQTLYSNMYVIGSVHEVAFKPNFWFINIFQGIYHELILTRLQTLLYYIWSFVKLSYIIFFLLKFMSNKVKKNTLYPWNVLHIKYISLYYSR